MFKAAIVQRFFLTAPLLTWSVVAQPLLAVATEIQPSVPTLTTARQPAIPTSDRIVTEPVQVVAAPSVAEQVSPATELTTLEQTDVEAQSDETDVDQTTSVSQLSDVQPTDWAFQALQSLVERYGCIAGYPDQTYRGQRALTRYEFAAGLNACLDRVNELIAAGTTTLVKQEDLTALQKLQEEFAAELATVRGRVTALEARTTTLAAQQFSTTTKLNGLVWFNMTGAFVDGSVTAERRFSENAFAAPRRNPITLAPSTFERQQPEVTASYYTFLTLTTSFTGKDSLITQLAAGNGNSPANQLVSAGFFNSWGTPFLDQTGTLSQGSVVIRELSYAFPIGQSVRLVVGPRINFYRYFDSNRFTFFLTGATSYNSNGSTLSNAVDRGSGAVAIWTINPQLRFTAGYLAENTEFVNSSGGFNTSSNPADGLFNSSNTITGELTFSPSKRFNIRLLYTRSKLKAYNGFIGGTVGEPLPYGYADDGFGGQLNDADADAVVLNFDWLITQGFGIFGRYSYGSTQIDPVNAARSGGSVDVQSIQFGVGLPDLGKKGALGVLSFLVPHDYLGGRRFLLSGAGDGGTQYELEASYYYPLTNNIAIVPAFYAIWNPNNFSSNSTVFVGNVRAQFSF
ncbi:carbohydrate porin [Phormidium sp. FACHB-592]|uniref:Iron uptake porin n=1 Tax=Stenomitos frigidus AS-A4 TaxID=2933935 RepID=A0ABV0KJ89_9CYAN|nr:iron uptake porin [Phormidium sp. FACHB-592]MBD2074687.1 carbohydrate porin [Phormidium sp. FACHB-592]